jgi:hypothetical protein
MPPFVPAPLTMIYVSGVAELLGGIGLLMPGTSRLAAWGLVALLVAIFPANLHVVLTGANAAGLPSSPWYTWSGCRSRSCSSGGSSPLGVAPAADATTYTHRCDAAPLLYCLQRFARLGRSLLR